MHRIKEILKEKGLDQKYLASKLGVTPPSVSMVISGNPTLEMLEKIAIALEVSVSELFEKKDYLRGTCPHCGQSITIDLKKAD